ncbi:hypothetical protein CL630_03355 [bacterium]|nr:hypothetical protein [bacterium]|tara:strand:- start:42035 stop:45427 length:3393 start_codon:yes stop_codon:yes gene_type:complete
MKYDHKKIEKKWQEKWEKQEAHKIADTEQGKKNYYTLVEFPYPSGNLHIGHWYAFAVPDIFARFKRMQGHNVLFPIGFDSFGLPAENAAIKNKVDPEKWTYENIARMTEQLKSMGASFDWSRQFATSDPDYYKWTQWLFLELHKKGLAERGKAIVNWDPVDKTVLANEQVLPDGTAERSGAQVEKKELEQWFLKITDYAERLLEDLGELNWPEEIKQSQREWIGRSEGAEIKFPVDGKYKFVLLHGFKATPSDNFHPWLKKELEKQGHEVVVPLLPNTNEPNEEEWVETVLSATDYDEKTIICGHSLGAVTALKVAEKLQDKIAGITLVGGFIDPRFKDHSRNFENTFKWEFDVRKIKNITGFIKILHDINDIAVSGEQAKRLGKTLGFPVATIEAKDSHFCGTQEPDVLKAIIPSINIFTTRPDTLFGATYLVLSPEHEAVENLKSQISNWDEVFQYIGIAANKPEIERTADNKEKAGVELKGIKAINPANNEEIPIWIADYVLAEYGTGAIMAVPAHDQRDFEFAGKFKLPIKNVIEPVFVQKTEPGKVREGKDFVERDAIIAIVKHWSGDKYIGLKWKQVDWDTLITGGIEEGQTSEEAAVAEIIEETGYRNPKLIKELPCTHSKFFHVPKDENRFAHFSALYFELENGDHDEISLEEKEKHEVVWLTREEMERFRLPESHRFSWNCLFDDMHVYLGDGTLVNSGKFDGMKSEDAKQKITEFVDGKKKTIYRLHDWLISRQRYWGCPIPIVYDPDGIPHPIPEKHLPWLLPKDVDFTPTGEPPLASSEELKKRTEKIFGEGWRPEYDTMDTFVDSSWYFLRYIDPHNEKEFASQEKLKKWMPVERYSGGAEHTTMHLLYSRFFHKALFDLGLVNKKEPYRERLNRGIILGTDGRKMSKRWGNVIDPDEHVKMVGADSVRMYLAFIGPYNAVGHYPWDTGGIAGTRRFLERVWKLQKKIQRPDSSVQCPELERLLHQTVKKVTEDIKNFKFNTAISTLMICVNMLDKQDAIMQSEYKSLLLLLAPFAPYITEELWGRLGLTAENTSIHTQKWPTHDEQKIQEQTFTIAIQVNSKVRDELEVSVEDEREEIEEKAKSLDKVNKWVQDKEIWQIVYIKGKLLNIVTKENS